MSSGPPAAHLDAFCQENHVALAGAPQGPLAGLRFALKDVFHVAGHRTGFGQPDWLRTHEPAETTAEVVTRLIEAGASLVGRTVTDELAYSLTGENVHYGTPVNPAAPERVPGGSSSGSAVVVARGTVDFALGTDCGGSVRVPASYCGVHGMRPTHGRVSLAGALPFAPSFDTAGWFARDGALLERVGRVLLGSDRGGARPRRLLVADDALALARPEVREAVLEALPRLARCFAGEPRHVMASPEEGLDAWRRTFQTLQGAEIWSSLGGWVSAVGPRLGPGVKERFEAAAAIPREAVEKARAHRRVIVRRLDELLGPGDVLYLPTVPRVAPPRGAPMDEVEIVWRNQAMCLLCIAGLGGLPQVSLPLSNVDGQPAGVSLVAPRGADETLLALAARVSERPLGPCRA